MQLINVVSIKRNNHIINGTIFLFLKTPYKQEFNKTTEQIPKLVEKSY